jgi:imidazoleglycerol phosphate dehydratase HisB
MQEEFLTRCVVDFSKRSFYLYSSEGDEKFLTCETVDQFMNVLGVVRALLNNSKELVYVNPIG